MLKDLLVLTLILGTLFGITLGRYPLAAPDGARYSEIPREMVVSGDYVTPHLNGIKYFEKPPLFYWLQAAVIKVFGANEIAVSLMNALLALGSALLVYLAAFSLAGRAAGFWSALVYATCALVFALTRVITLDVALTFFLTGMLTTFLLATKEPRGKKRRLILALSYGCIGCAVMTKGLVGMVFPGIFVLAWLTIKRDWRELGSYYPWMGLTIFLLITLPWHLLVQMRNPEFFRFYFLEQHFLRYLTDYAHRSKGWWFFPALSIVGFYPWIAFVPSAICSKLQQLRSGNLDRRWWLIFIWLITIYLFYMFSNSKLIPYLLPIFPALAILVGSYLADVSAQSGVATRNFRYSIYIVILFNLGLALLALISCLGVDFSQQAIRQLDLIIVGIWMLLSAALLYGVRQRSVQYITALIAVTSSVAWLYMSPNITIINRQSIKPLITILQQQTRPQDEVICYEHYYQELPFYLQRHVTIVDFLGELEFGTQHQDTRAWMIDRNEFSQRWSSAAAKYMVISEQSFNHLKSVSKLPNLLVIARHLDTLLVTNQK